MPLYEYECRACGKRTELLQRFVDPPLAACPECGGEVKKLFSSPSFQFKGSGWYATDYAAKKAPAEGGAGGSEAAPAGGAKDAGDGKSAGEGGGKPATAASTAESSGGGKSRGSESTSAAKSAAEPKPASQSKES